MISKKEIMERICDLETYVGILEDRIEKLEKPAKKTTKKVTKK